jgi:hypothetical protein
MSQHIEKLVGLIDLASRLYVMDLRALPADSFHVSPMGVARTPQDITTEVAGFNRLCVDMLSDREHNDGNRELLADVGAAQAEVEESSKALSTTLAGMSPEALLEPVTAPWGQEMSKYDLAQMAAFNTVYHDGQLNYFQALHGDGEMHWS